MKTVIRNWTDLHDYGIICLTGEACGLGMRLLCDLTPKGEETLTAYFGHSISFTQGSNWNSSDGQVASVMLPYTYAFLQSLAVFCMLHQKKAQVVAVCKNEVRAIKNEEELQRFREYAGEDYIRCYGTWNEHVKERNTHQMSGRTV